MDLRSGIIETANAIGLPPEDLATIISYESGFRPDVWGGKGGNYYGLIQFGPAERQQYGVRVGDVTSQLGEHGAIANYFRDRGFKPGMGLLDAYSTVNAGRPGLYNRSDAAAGGMPGTVADKVNQQFGPHRQKAMAFLGNADPNPPTGGQYNLRVSHPPNPTVGTGGYTAPGANTTPVQPTAVAKDAAHPWAKALSGVADSLGGAMQAPVVGQGGAIPQLPMQAPMPQQAMPMVAESMVDENRRNQLAALMQQYWI